MRYIISMPLAIDFSVERRIVTISQAVDFEDDQEISISWEQVSLLRKMLQEIEEIDNMPFITEQMFGVE